MLTKSSTLFLLAATCLLASCTEHYYYAPNTLHMPTTKVVGEATIEASLNGSQQSRGGELKLGYMPHPKTSIMLNTMYLRGAFEKIIFGTITITEQHSGRGGLVELGLTRHFPLNEYTDFTLTAGGGGGRATNFYDRARRTELNFNRMFIQPSFITKGELANIGVGLRYSRLGFHSASIDAAIDEDDLNDIQKIERKGAFFIPELGLTAGINYAPIHVNCNMVLALYGGYAFSNSNFNVSLRYDLMTKASKKKRKIENR
jgi:hypothetical protein